MSSKRDHATGNVIEGTEKWGRADAVTRVCIGCGTDFSFIGWKLAALCPDCKAKQDAADMARTACPRCKSPMEPAPCRLVCEDCSLADLLDSVARYGSN